MRAEVTIGILSVLATLVGAIIQRNWRLRRRRLPTHESLAIGQVHESASFVALDVVKILDVGDGGEPGVAVLTDSYLIRRESDTGTGVVFRYATSGTLEGQCVSHADGYVASSYNSSHYPTSTAISVLLSQVARGTTSRVTNRITYTGAFDRPDGEDFETHVERPTRSLTFVLATSRARAAAFVTGKVQVGERGSEETVKEGPVVSHDGSTVYWRILPTRGEWLPIGARYALSWRWQRRTPISSASGRE